LTDDDAYQLDEYEDRGGRRLWMFNEDEEDDYQEDSWEDMKWVEMKRMNTSTALTAMIDDTWNHSHHTLREN
jgi:hypothetical protein